MISAVDAGRILARLQAHWPRLADNDLAADDWLQVIRRSPDAETLADSMIRGWVRDRAPRIGDWQQEARVRIAAGRVDTRPLQEIEGPPLKPVDRKDYQTRLKERKEKRALERVKNFRWSELRYPNADAVPMLPYEASYEEGPE